MKKHLISFTAAICTATLLPLNAGATSPSVQITYSGKCGDNLTWKNENGILTISGTGDMYSRPAWNTPAFTKVVIEDGVTSISQEAFWFRSNITDIEIADSVTSIGESAFWRCTNLDNIKIPESVTSIGRYAFTDTAFILNPENYEDGLLYLSKFLINADPSLISGECIIKDGTEIITEYAFTDCDTVTSVTVPDSITEIGPHAFWRSSLTQITLPPSVTKIAEHAFQYCENLTEITLPDTLTSIGEYAFGDCTSLTHITIPPSVTELGEGVFSDCTSLTDVLLPDGLSIINHATFAGCTSLTEITIPSSVKEIDYLAFPESLTDVYFTGTEEEWQEINIHGNNLNLENATLHFSHTARLTDVTAAQNGSSCTFTAETENLTGYEMLVIALYEGGRLTASKSLKITDEISDITIDTATADNARIFLLNSLNRMRPTGAVFEIGL